MSFIDTSKDLCTLFSNQVTRTPNALALEDENRTYTYIELAQAVDALAKRLRTYGVKRDSCVGVLLPRSADYVISCLAALQAGGAYLVLELAYPPDLLADVLEDATPAVVITRESESGKIREGIPQIVLDRQSNAQLPNGAPPSHKTEINYNGKNEDGSDDLDRLCFVSYSSGTTGKSKGIANPHRASVLSYNLRFGISDVKPDDRVACNVFFVWEIIRPLLRGGTVVTVPDEVSYDPVGLVDLLASKKVTETLMTPTLLAAVLSRFPDIGSRLQDLRTLWFNGEVVTTDLARRALFALPNVRLLNCYSACETHEIACGDIREIIDEKLINCPVGKPLEPENIYVLDEEGNKVEPGTSGELYVGGDLLARGYLNLPEVTAKAFLPNKFKPEDPTARMYRTGDLAILHPSGLLEITGRTGAMIKLRGYSVVPAKVQSTIVQYLGVRHCAVVAHGDGLDRQLVAYIVRDDETPTRPLVEIDELGHSPAARKHISPYLAQYMLPTLWVELESLPTQKVSGKVDLKNLPPPPSPKKSSGVTTPKDSISLKDIAEVWATTLSVPENTLKPDHSFFDLGGHSLSLAALSAKLSRKFGFRIPVSRLADPSTLESHLSTVRDVRDGTIAAVQADLPAALRRDSTLDRDIEFNDARIRAVKDADVILLTGATGFLGAFLLSHLLESTAATIICLIRGNDLTDEEKPSCTARLRRNLIELGLWRDSIMERVEILPADLPRKRLGLSQEKFTELGKRVQVVVHAAAQVNLVYPYAALRGTNVDGVREILRMASIGGATVLHVSTNGVLPHSDSRFGWPEDSMLYVDAVPEKIPDGYGQTKWAAEQLVLEAGRRGLPVRILRAGTISGHSSTGAANPWDLLTALFVESIQLGYYPDVEGWRAEMTPVDFVSKAIVHLGNQTHAKQLVFHLGDPDPIDTKTVFQHFNELGYPTKPLEFEKWVDLWNERRSTAKGGDGAFTVDILRSSMPGIEFLRDIVVLNNAQTRPFRAIVERPKVDAVLLETYARHWFARGWMSHPPLRNSALGGSAVSVRKSILSGKVAVITGASSGIGAAVATALASEGCHLVLAARRAPVLDSLKRRLAVFECKVITKATDVTKKAEVDDLFTTAERELGQVDILVSCAGVMYYTMMANVKTDDWNTTVDVNCKGLLHCLAASVPPMLSRGAGHIVAISSDAGRKVFPGLGVYSASKFFVEATLQSLRLETAGKGLRVTSVQPGNTATDLLGMSTDEQAIEAYGKPTGAQILDPTDVANSIVYALKQPEHVAVNEILIEPRDEPI
jgi:amino acid adenylation domain-containing protein/thioester reductase-like protein